MTSNASQMVQIGSQAPPGPQTMSFDNPTCPEQLFENFSKSKVRAQNLFLLLHSCTSIKNAFLRQCWQLTCLSIFHIMPNATRGVKYVTISNFSTSRFLIQGFILKKINFFQLLLPKCFKNKLKTFEKCLQKVEKNSKFFFLRNRFSCILNGPDSFPSILRTSENVFRKPYMPRTNF